MNRLGRRLSILIVVAAGCGGVDPTLGEDSAAVTASLSDEFNDAATLSNWAILNADLGSSIDVNTTTPGNLTIIPRAITHNAWFSDDQAPYVYKNVTGNFVVEISVRVASTGSRDPNVSPQGQFNSGGFVVRDPASSGRSDGSPHSTPSGHESWLMYNLGFQTNGIAREAKTTLNNASGESLSTLFLNATPNGVNNARLRICRLGSSFRMYHMHPTETSWVEEPYLRTTQRLGNGAGNPTPGVGGGVVRFTRTDLPSTLQVGVVGNAWGAPFQTRAEFDYIRFGAATRVADCTAAITTQL